MKSFLPIIILILFLVFVSSGVIYISKRFISYFDVTMKKLVYVIFASLTLYILVGVIPFTNSTSWVGSAVYLTATLIMGLIFYILLSSYVVDLARLVFKFSRFNAGIAVLVLAVLIVIYGIYTAFSPVVYRVNVPITNLKEAKKVIHLTDLHIGHYRGKEFLAEIVQMSKKEKPDFVVITGDLFDGKIELSMDVLEPLKAFEVPVYFVEGNHDVYTAPLTIKSYLRNSGIIVLENELTNFGDIQIIGLDHMLPDTSTFKMRRKNNNTIQSVLEKLYIDDSRPSILLHHSPDGLKYADKHGIDLYLAGHTHGGQIFPVTLIAEFLFEVNKGLTTFGDTKVYVSQGAGTFGPPMRIATVSEITLINLLPDIRNE